MLSIFFNRDSTFQIKIPRFKKLSVTFFDFLKLFIIPIPALFQRSDHELKNAWVCFAFGDVSTKLLQNYFLLEPGTLLMYILISVDTQWIPSASMRQILRNSAIQHPLAE